MLFIEYDGPGWVLTYEDNIVLHGRTQGQVRRRARRWIEGAGFSGPVTVVEMEEPEDDDE